MPIDNVNQIITLGSGQIRRIVTLPVTRYYGDMQIAGILAVFSKGHFIDNIHFKTPTLKWIALSSQPYTKPVPFKPSSGDKRIPDFRQLLLWEPEIIIGKSNETKVECYASDLPGRYRIDIRGLTSDGKPLNGSAIITVQSKLK